MCLDVVYRGKEKKEILDKLPDTITIWKVVSKRDDGYKTDCVGMPLHAGEVTFKQNIIRDACGAYCGGGHFFLHYRDALGWPMHEGDRLVKCRVKKDWIVNIGVQGYIKNFVVVVVKKAIFPKYIGGLRNAT